MTDKGQDPNLGSPQEANTTKHINFLEAEEAAAADTNDTSDADADADNPTKKAWEELRRDQRNEEASKE